MIKGYSRTNLYVFFCKLSVSTTVSFCSSQHYVCLHLSQKLLYILSINKAMAFYVRYFPGEIFSQTSPSLVYNVSSGNFPRLSQLQCSVYCLFQLQRSAPQPILVHSLAHITFKKCHFENCTFGKIPKTILVQRSLSSCKLH